MIVARSEHDTCEESVVFARTSRTGVFLQRNNPSPSRIKSVIMDSSNECLISNVSDALNFLLKTSDALNFLLKTSSNYNKFLTSEVFPNILCFDDIDFRRHHLQTIYQQLFVSPYNKS